MMREGSESVEENSDFRCIKNNKKSTSLCEFILTLRF